MAQEAQVSAELYRDSGMLGKNTFVEVMLTKYDFVEAAPGARSD